MHKVIPPVTLNLNGTLAECTPAAASFLQLPHPFLLLRQTDSRASRRGRYSLSTAASLFPANLDPTAVFWLPNFIFSLFYNFSRRLTRSLRKIGRIEIGEKSL